MAFLRAMFANAYIFARSPSSPFHHANWSKQITGYPNGYPVICMARWKGLEPPTFWFVAKHSIQLSYQRIGPLRRYFGAGY